MESLPSYTEENVNKIVYLFDKTFPAKIKLAYIGELINVLRGIGKYASELEPNLFESLSTRILKNFEIIMPSKKDMEGFYFLPDEILEEMCSEINLICVTHKREIADLFQKKIDELEHYKTIYHNLEKHYYNDLCS